jgi:Domain of unknown function DUF11/WD40-like Beta Propeller Repeat
MIFRISRLPFYSTIGLLCFISGNALAGQTTRANISSTGVQSNISTPTPHAISANGRYIAFADWSSNLVTKDTNQVSDIFVRDQLTRKTTRISVSSKGVQGNHFSGYYLSSQATRCVSISGDGRYIAFKSYASNLVAGDTDDTPDVFVHDRLTGKTERISDASNVTDGALAYEVFGDEVNISADGRYVAFISLATEFSNKGNMYIYDRQTHITKVVSVNFNGNKIGAVGRNISLSADGRYIAFESYATNLITGDTNDATDVFVYDYATQKIERISGNNGGSQANISANGRYVVFLSGDDNGSHIYVHDRSTHKTENNIYFSLNGKIPDSGLISRPSISGDGRYVVFSSHASNLVAGDTNFAEDFFVRDRLTRKTERVSVASNGAQGFSNGSNSVEPSINADGRYVTFLSSFKNIVANDTNKISDIFVRDRLLDTKHHADLKITPTTKPSTLKLNSKGDYLYTITNSGKDVVPDVSLIHLVSGGSAVSFKPSQGKCSFSTVETVCHLGKLAAGKKLTLHVMVKAQSKALNQQVTVSGAPVDIKPINNQISVTTPIK